MTDCLEKNMIDTMSWYPQTAEWNPAASTSSRSLARPSAWTRTAAAHHRVPRGVPCRRPWRCLCGAGCERSARCKRPPTAQELVMARNVQVLLESFCPLLQVEPRNGCRWCRAANHLSAGGGGPGATENTIGEGGGRFLGSTMDGSSSR